MSTKYVTEDNLNDILEGIAGKFIQVNQNVSRTVTDLITTPITLTTSVVNYDLLYNPLDFDEVEFECVFNRSDGQVKTFNGKISNKELQDMYVADSATARHKIIENVYAGTVENSTLKFYARIVIRYLTDNPKAFNIMAGAGEDSVLSSSSVVINRIKGINYTQSFGDVPLGTIITFMGQTPPDEYLACDGTTYNITDYWELAEFFKTQFGSYNKFGGDGTVTFAVPDLRGEFLRGTGTNSHTNCGSGAAVGTHQTPTFSPNIWIYTGSASDNNGVIVGEFGPGGTGVSVTSIDSSITTSARIYGNASVTKTRTTQTGTVTYSARPTNTSILYCIKYTNSSTRQPANEYSTEERRIGTWIDGKPLYQVVISGTLPASGTLNTAIDVKSLSSLSMDTLVSLDAITEFNKSAIKGGTPNGIYNTSSTSENGVTFFIRSSNASLACVLYASARWGNLYHVILKYTKQ